MSDGSIDIPRQVRILGKLNISKREATIEVNLLRVVTDHVPLFTEVVDSVKFYIREGNGYKEREGTIIKKLN